MPVTTRSQKRISSILQDEELYTPFKRARTSENSFVPKISNKISKAPVASRKPSKPRLPLKKKRIPPPQKLPKRPQKQSHNDQDSARTKPPSQTRTNLADFPPNAFIHPPCNLCDCPEGVFELSIDSCIRCGHEMDGHEYWDHPWGPNCDYLVERPELVSSILELVVAQRVVAIRATPQVGKTTLLYLLGLHILSERWDLEPVFVHWIRPEDRKNITYSEFLESKKAECQKINARYRPHNPKAKTIYLVDEAQGSYEEEEFWARDLKGRNTKSRALFVLVCLYGAAGTSRTQNLRIESQAQFMDTLQRVELRPSMTGHPYMLFKPGETVITINKWATQNKYKLEDGVAEYIHTATDGHPGMVGIILRRLEDSFSQFPDKIREARTWSPNLCHQIIVQHNELLNWLIIAGRGFWTARAERYTRLALTYPDYKHIKFSQVANVLRMVAERPNGYMRLRPNQEMDAFAFCYMMGYLHTEQSRPGSDEITYIFASPIHRRVAYRRLFTGTELLETVSLQQACLNAIERFSLSVLQNRFTQSQNKKSWGVPEATFQDEIYCCLNYELHNLPILSEYSPTKDGRIDFYIFDKKWGIEVLQNGTNKDIENHANRFRIGGKYQAWNILDDYIILNFCPKSKLQALNIQDIEIQSHLRQVAIDVEEHTAEVYTHDKQLQATLSLGEGRQRSEPYIDDDDDDQWSNNSGMRALQEHLREKEEQIIREKEEMIREKEEMLREKEMIREKEEMLQRERRDAAREREEMMREREKR